MNIYLKCGVFILLAAINAGCKGFARYTIDEKPIVKIDTHLLGIWKAVEDTDRANYILIQSNYDGTNTTRGNNYYITYMNMHGLNPLYQQWTAFTSVVSNAKFLNIDYRYTSRDNTPVSLYGPTLQKGKESVQGYFFVRLIKVNKDCDTITTAVIADTDMEFLKSSREVRSYISKNIQRLSFYNDTLHFYKVSNYHHSLKESIHQAN